jgi:hypothetical protein
MRVPAAFQAYLAHFRRSGRATAFRKNCSQVNNRDPVYQEVGDAEARVVGFEHCLRN